MDRRSLLGGSGRRPPSPPGHRRTLGRALVALVVAAASLVALGRPAGAHAELVATEPAGGAALGEAPGRVVLRFTEAVGTSAGALRVVDADGQAVDVPALSTLDGDPTALGASLPPLDDGAYVVAWRVTSADSHPIRGAFGFRVGAGAGATDTGAVASALLAADEGSPAVGGLFAAVRFVGFLALALLAGGLGFVVLAWPAGVGVARVRRLLWAAWAGALVATVAGVGLQGAYAAGRPLGAALDPGVVADALGANYGRVSLAQVALLALAAPLLAAAARRADGTRRPGGVPDGSARPGGVPDGSARPGGVPDGTVRPGGALVAAALVAAALLAGPALKGHAGVGGVFTLSAWNAYAHTAAVSLWLGGLTLLGAVVLSRRRADELSAVVPRFSTLAFAAVVVAVATGAVQGWQQVGALDALTTTTYGRWLVAKVALFATMVALGGLARTWVRARYRAPVAVLSPGPGAAAADPDAEVVRRLRRSVGAEVALGAVVLAATAVLVNVTPARAAVSRPFAAELHTESLIVDVTVDPARVGPTEVHLYTLDHAGAATEVEELTAELALPAQDLGPLDVPLERAGPGHFVASAYDLPLAGDWELEVVARVSDVDQERATMTLPVR